MENGSVALPADFVHNRFIVKPIAENGSTLYMLADTGGGCVLTPEAVSRARLTTFEGTVGDARYDMAELPNYREDAWIPPLIIGGKPGACIIMNRGYGILGQAWFADRVWTFDYFAGTLIYHGAGGKSLLEQKERCVRLNFQEDGDGKRNNSFPRIQAVIDGEVIDFLFDTGATLNVSDQGLAELNDNGGRQRGTCFITESVFRRWMKRNPHWRVIDKAEQSTGLPIIEVPEVTIAGYTVGPVWFTFRPDHNFHRFISDLMDRRVEGALGGSVLQYFRVTVDYPNGLALFER
ncbi:hypothetical protein FE783_34170 [Paenibacillus mesophilus]|uniref:hypothetical protein n=1 Tax=Paenibacillus mesophilus TaxID=2582849 RepID=UPI00110F1DCA|nr:hypothetical protein [Paenibacillus mesophilus]TMV43816.1 hypothetical protein FE783_34170 [Paenibacillus mesophilus]